MRSALSAFLLRGRRLVLLSVVVSASVLDLEAKPRPPLPPPPEYPLLFLRFNDTDDSGVMRPVPLKQTNIQRAESWSGYALDMSGNAQRLLQYSMAEARESLAPRSIRFWFQPGWTSSSLVASVGSSERCLIRAGDPSAWWMLRATADGNRLRHLRDLLGSG